MAKARKKQYEVDTDKKVIIANVKKLNDAEMQAVKNYLALGFTLKDATIKAKSKGLFTKKNIEEFCKKNDIKFDIKALSNELNDNGKKKGFIHAQREFRNKYEDMFLEYMDK